MKWIKNIISKYKRRKFKWELTILVFALGIGFLGNMAATYLWKLTNDYASIIIIHLTGILSVILFLGLFFWLYNKAK